MQGGDRSLDPHAVDAALRELTPCAELLLRVRFGIGRYRRRATAGVSALPRQRQQEVEASALRRLR
jgi:hypothetical protein